MRAVFLAAGGGTRCWPLTTTRPKPLLPVGDESLLTRLLRQARDAGCAEATVVVADPDDAVASAAIAWGDANDWAVDVSVQEVARGTGDALAQAGPFDDAFIAANGDVFVEDDAFGAIMKAPGDAVIAAAHVPDAAPFGRLALDGDRFTGVDEKGAGGPGPVNAGVYRFPGGFHDDLAALKPSPRGELELTDAINTLLGRSADFRAVPLATWSDVGWPWDLLNVQEIALADLVGRIDGDVEAGATLKGEVVVEAGALVKAGAYLEGPILIREGATVGPNCYVRGATVVGPRAKIGNAAEVKNSLLFEDAKIPHLSYVGDSILGADVNLGAGTLVANLRHDKATIHSWTPRGRIDTGRRKFGIVLGDGVKTGINSTLNVGVMLGAGEMVGPGEVVKRSRVPE